MPSALEVILSFSAHSAIADRRYAGPDPPVRRRPRTIQSEDAMLDDLVGCVRDAYVKFGRDVDD
jgi:hypothetical protein